jgi:serine/threonine-protein kinase
VSSLRQFYQELRRRKVLRGAAAYAAVAFVLVQVADAAFPMLLLPEWAGTLLIALLILGFPAALVLSWAFDFSLEGVKREDPAPPAIEKGAFPPDAPVGAAAFDTGRFRTIRANSIAVLPFENLGPIPEDEYFADGLTDDIIAAVGRIKGLQVLCRTTVMEYKRARRNVKEIAVELGVAYVVEGTVRRSGNKLRVVAQVIDARRDDNLWSETFDQDVADVFKVQSEVAAEVAFAVRRELSPADRDRIQSRGTTDPRAYDLYLRGRFLWNQRSESAVRDSVDYFGRAIDLDPAFALAHAALADAQTVLGIYGVSPSEHAFGAARQSASRALELDPSMGEAKASLGCVKALYDWDWDAAELEFQQASAAAPSYATGHQWYAVNCLAPRGRFAEASRELERAEDLDPYALAIATSRGILAFYARDLKRAKEAFEAVNRLHPRFGLVQFFLGQCLEAMGRQAEAVEALAQATRLAEDSSETLAAHAHALALGGSDADARNVLSRLQARAARRYVSPVLLAQVHLGLGDRDTALTYLERGLAVRAADMVWLGVRPVYDPLRDEPRFQALVSEVGVV